MPEHQALTEAVRRKLRITWNDDATDARVADVAAHATPAVARLVGIDPADGTAMEAMLADPEAVALVCNAAYYEWNDAMDEFRRNYADEIHAMRIRNEMEAADA